MSKSLALLSGKGGSGKTTLALSISSMLSNCGIKVLLIDCDFSTNGATYFYESKLNENNYALSSFIDVLNEDLYNEVYFLYINNNFDFLPSILKITDNESMTYSYNYEDKQKIKKFIHTIDSKYDVIIYDCQAGYTDLLKVILPYIDTNLVVMEADAISSSSIRSLYLKIGNIINKKKVHQIFNKATHEEYDIYSKISGGTVFTNIETVVFDWKIRKAFSIAQIPDMENTSANYGKQVFNICNIIFSEGIIQEKLKQFKYIIERNKKIEDEKIINEKIEEIQKNRITVKNKWFKALYAYVIPTIATAFSFMIYIMMDNQFFSFDSSTKILSSLVVLSIGITLFFILFNLIETTKEIKEQQKKINDFRKVSIKLNNEIEELTNKFSEAKKRNQLN